VFAGNWRTPQNEWKMNWAKSNGLSSMVASGIGISYRDPPLIVALDGGFVHAKDQPSRSEGWFEVIVGKEHAERRREQMLGLCPNLRPEAEAAFVRITQEPEYADESADHVPDRRRGRHP
jgi:hypothetical protein